MNAVQGSQQKPRSESRRRPGAQEHSRSTQETDRGRRRRAGKKSRVTAVGRRRERERERGGGRTGREEKGEEIRV